ncbi:hypothetical protein JE48_018545 [Vibrio cholerae O1 biovar El Tor]|nr:hypothetical protein JE48_018545 [Vibrio cholerae O1 biovar El Tor]
MSVELTSAVFASDIVEFKENNDKNSIIQLVKHRYDERFINPFRDNSLKTWLCDDGCMLLNG